MCTCACSNVFYGEYNCFGPGAVPTQRVNWAHKLTIRQFAHFMVQASALRRTIIGSDGGGGQRGASTPIGGEGNKAKENERDRQGAPPRALIASATTVPTPIGRGEGDGDGNKETENGRKSPEQAPASTAGLTIE